MSKSKRKYLSEFAVNLFTARWQMTTAHSLMRGGEMNAINEEIANACHIYLICKVPSLSYEEESFTYDYDRQVISGNLIYKIEGEEFKLPFNRKFPLLDDAVKLSLSKYPYKEIQTLDSNNEIVRTLPAEALCYMGGMHANSSDLSHLEVLYVGQAYADGKRIAFDRLKSHSTLQKILAEASYSYPDDDIYVLAFEYHPYRVITQTDPRANPQFTGDEDDKRFYNILDNELTEYQQICLAEAGLIKYFQPEYNKTYKENFPSEKHTILEECYYLDFSALAVEINTEELGFFLFSKSREPNSHHIANFELISHKERLGFFHFSTKEGEVEKFINVIESRK